MLSSLKKLGQFNMYNQFKMVNQFNQFKQPLNLFNTSQKYFGKNEKVIKLRMKSVSSIAKITKAMKMVINNVNIRCLQVK